MWLVFDLEWYFSPYNYLLSHAAPKRNKHCNGGLQIRRLIVGKYVLSFISASDEAPWQINTAQSCSQISWWCCKVKKCDALAFVFFMLKVVILATQQMGW